jgi:NAD(P)-dependent dehydrogenase (short-subunit alcohol dehydrogenase family)
MVGAKIAQRSGSIATGNSDSLIDPVTEKLHAMAQVRRHVAVIGATGGIGRALAQRFATGGDIVYLMGRDPVRLQQELEALLSKTGGEAHVVPCHVDRVESLADAIAQPPRLDVLINAAGSIPRHSLLDTNPDQWRGPWSDKVLGTIEATRLACARMREADGGVVVNIIGTAGVRLNPKTIMTTTANAALIAFTQALGAQSVDFNVRVVGINPGLTATPRTESLAAGQGGDSYRTLLQDLPFGRMAKAQEVAECAWFAVSSQASYISGTIIDVDAGARWRT